MISHATPRLLEYPLWFVILSEAKDLLLPAIEENYASSRALLNNSISHLILGGEALQRRGKTLTLLHEREGHGFKSLP